MTAGRAVEMANEFQSTRPVKGATIGRRENADIGLFQSTRPVKGATPIGWRVDVGDPVSIHAPREGRDAALGKSAAVLEVFQSTRPVKGATCCERLADRPRHRFNPRAP